MKTTTLANVKQTMSKQIETGTSTPPASQFDSPLSLWITVWPRQLVYGTA
jgi:hypothetical protein